MPNKKNNSTKWQKVKTVSTAVGLTIAQHLLDTLLELGSLIPEPFETRQSHIRRIKGLPQFPNYRVRQEIKRMKQRGWVIEIKKSGKNSLQLTPKGKLYTLHKKLLAVSSLPKKKWDGKWRMAIFDIPEKEYLTRNTIRRILKSVGFYQLQKSVYIYPYEIPGEVITYLKESGLISFIRFARIDLFDDDQDLRKWFNL